MQTPAQPSPAPAKNGVDMARENPSGADQGTSPAVANHPDQGVDNIMESIESLPLPVKIAVPACFMLLCCLMMVMCCKSGKKKTGVLSLS
jgi:hypothetical protein